MYLNEDQCLEYCGFTLVYAQIYNSGMQQSGDQLPLSEMRNSSKKYRKYRHKQADASFSNFSQFMSRSKSKSKVRVRAPSENEPSEIKLEKLIFSNSTSSPIHRSFRPPKASISRDKFNLSATSRFSKSKASSGIYQQTKRQGGFLNANQTADFSASLPEFIKRINQERMALYDESPDEYTENKREIKSKIEQNALSKFQELFKKQSSHKNRQIELEQSKKLLGLLQSTSRKNSARESNLQKRTAKAYLRNPIGTIDRADMPQNELATNAKENNLKRISDKKNTSGLSNGHQGFEGEATKLNGQTNKVQPKNLNTVVDARISKPSLAQLKQKTLDLQESLGKGQKVQPQVEVSVQKVSQKPRHKNSFWDIGVQEDLRKSQKQYQEQLKSNSIEQPATSGFQGQAEFGQKDSKFSTPKPVQKIGDNSFKEVQQVKKQTKNNNQRSIFKNSDQIDEFDNLPQIQATIKEQNISQPKKKPNIKETTENIGQKFKKSEKVLKQNSQSKPSAKQQQKRTEQRSKEAPKIAIQSVEDLDDLQELNLGDPVPTKMSLAKAPNSAINHQQASRTSLGEKALEVIKDLPGKSDKQDSPIEKFEESESGSEELNGVVDELLYYVGLVETLGIYNTTSKEFYSKADSSMVELTMNFRLAAYYVAHQFYYYEKEFIDFMQGSKSKSFYSLNALELKEAMQDEESKSALVELKESYEMTPKLIKHTFQKCKAYLPKKQKTLQVDSAVQYHEKACLYVKEEFKCLYKLLKNSGESNLSLAERCCLVIEYYGIMMALRGSEFKEYEELEYIGQDNYMAHIEKFKGQLGVN